MTSQLLNWYEEGTWTPAFTSTGLTVTYAIQNGKYTRIGRLVTVSGYVQVSGVSGITTNGLTVAGLPFATTGGAEYGHSGVFGVQQFLGVIPSAFITAGSSSITLYQQGTLTALLGSALASGYYLFSITYQI
jgi:hypothetical protein